MVLSTSLPKSGFLRIRQIVGDPKANPPLLPIIPVSAASWWAGIKTGRYPKPTKLGPRTTAWSIDDINKLIADLKSGQHE